MCLWAENLSAKNQYESNGNRKTVWPKTESLMFLCENSTSKRILLAMSKLNERSLTKNKLFVFRKQCRSTLNNTMGQIVYSNWKHYNIVCSSKACGNTLSFSSSHAFVQWNTSSFICPSFYLYWSIGIRRRRHLYTGRSWQGYPGGCLECRQASPAWCDQSILLCLTTNVFLSVFTASEHCIHIVDFALLMSLHTITVQQDASRQLTSDKAEQISKHHVMLADDKRMNKRILAKCSKNSHVTRKYTFLEEMYSEVWWRWLHIYSLNSSMVLDGVTFHSSHFCFQNSSLWAEFSVDVASSGNWDIHIYIYVHWASYAQIVRTHVKSWKIKLQGKN